MVIKNVGIFNENSGFENGCIAISKDRITGFTAEGLDDDELDATGLLAIPGLVDIHFHGAVGCDFCNGNLESIDKIAEYELKNGITAICPATMTYPEDVLKKVVTAAAAYKEIHDGDAGRAQLVGINMEGPFISPEKTGAQNPDYIQKPDFGMFERLYEASEGLIKLVDIAPEVEDATEFINSCKDKVKISVAHTDADFDMTDAAFKAGASHVTHLYNAMNPIHHRKPGPIIAALENGAEVELIADGVHIHPAMVRFTFNSFDRDKIILISDSMEATGLEDGEYQLGGQAVIKKGRLATLKESEGVVAGSATNLFDCMKEAVLNMGIDKKAAIKAATINPARSIGIDNDHGLLEKGKLANILIVDEKLDLVHVINRGKLIF